ncbi:putative uncharacterized protein DDB_G0277255 [Panonychus citri]|uniref:putative uncharacterized protein DDB_G0277255 n=1 Tax=Panonychus citri TaxID=50023 RepID=UPI002307D532|nr:putative uncharacterized protein DDB_G0277255 [Panonychus citri]
MSDKPDEIPINGSNNLGDNLNCSEAEVVSRSLNCNNPCYICLCELTDPCYADGCLHIFCTPCLSQWSKQSNRCPVCRTTFNNIICNVLDDHLYDEIPVSESTTGHWSSNLLNVTNYWDSMIDSMVTNLTNVLNLPSPREIFSNYLEYPRESTTTININSSSSNSITAINLIEPQSGWTLVQNRRNRRNQFRSNHNRNQVIVIDDDDNNNSDVIVNPNQPELTINQSPLIETINETSTNNDEDNQSNDN